MIKIKCPPERVLPIVIILLTDELSTLMSINNDMNKFTLLFSEILDNSES